MVHLSVFSMISSAAEQILQKTVPNIMLVRSEEKRISTSPMRQSPFSARTAKDTVRKTKETARQSLLELDLKIFSARLSSPPSRPPINRDRRISSNGLITTEITSMLPPLDCTAWAIPKETAKATSPIASSRATTGNSTSVTFPLALYCFTTIMVAAGAVAEAMAPKVKAAEIGSFSGMIKCKPINAASTRRTAIKDSNRAITTDCFPTFFKTDILNSEPMENAINPSATSETTERLEIRSGVIYRSNPGI